MALHTVSFDTEICVYTYCAEWGNDDLPCVMWIGPLTSSRQNFLTSMGSSLGEEWLTSFSTAVLYELVQGSCSNPEMTAAKWVFVSTLWLPLQAPPWSSSSWPYLLFWIQPQLGPSQSRLWLVWPATAHPHYSFWSLGSWRLTSMNPRYGMAEPLSPLVPITKPGAGSAVQDLCKTGSLYWRPEHLNQWLQLFPACPQSMGLH